MGEPAYQLPSYVGLQPVEYKGFVLGLERLSTVWQELTELAEQEWAEVGDSDRLGLFAPDFALCIRHEKAGNIGAVTVRRLGDWLLQGYFVGVLGAPLKNQGKKVLNEVGVYLVPEARFGWMAAKLLDYTEEAAKLFGADGLIISHRPENDRIGKLYQRRGFVPLSVDYIKRFDS